MCGAEGGAVETIDGFFFFRGRDRKVLQEPEALRQSDPIIDWPSESDHTKYLFNPRVIPVLWKQPILDLASETGLSWSGRSLKVWVRGQPGAI